jgi:hypothetical protein
MDKACNCNDNSPLKISGHEIEELYKTIYPSVYKRIRLHTVQDVSHTEGDVTKDTDVRGLTALMIQKIQKMRNVDSLTVIEKNMLICKASIILYKIQSPYMPQDANVDVMYDSKANVANAHIKRVLQMDVHETRKEAEEISIRTMYLPCLQHTSV